MIFGKYFAIHLIGQQGVLTQCLMHRERPSESTLRRFKIKADELHTLCFKFNAGFCQDISHGDTSPNCHPYTASAPLCTSGGLSHCTCKKGALITTTFDIRVE